MFKIKLYNLATELKFTSFQCLACEISCVSLFVYIFHDKVLSTVYFTVDSYYSRFIQSLWQCVPCIGHVQSWGSELDENNGLVTDFLESLDKFTGSLAGVNGNMTGQVELKESEHDATLKQLKTLSDYKAAGTVLFRRLYIIVVLGLFFILFYKII